MDGMGWMGSLDGMAGMNGMDLMPDINELMRSSGN